jgi:hypothetical protein
MLIRLLNSATATRRRALVAASAAVQLRLILLACGLVICSQTLFAQGSQLNLFNDEAVSRLADKQQQVVERIRKRPLNAEMRVARLQNFNQILLSKGITFNLLPNANFAIQRTRVEQTGERSYIWRGEFGRDGRAMLSIHDKAIAGYVQDGKNLYEIQSITGYMRHL